MSASRIDGVWVRCWRQKCTSKSNHLRPWYLIFLQTKAMHCGQRLNQQTSGSSVNHRLMIQNPASKFFEPLLVPQLDFLPILRLVVHPLESCHPVRPAAWYLHWLYA